MLMLMQSNPVTLSLFYLQSRRRSACALSLHTSLVQPLSYEFANAIGLRLDDEMLLLIPTPRLSCPTSFFNQRLVFLAVFFIQEKSVRNAQRKYARVLFGFLLADLLLEAGPSV